MARHLQSTLPTPPGLALVTYSSDSESDHDGPAPFDSSALKEPSLRLAAASAVPDLVESSSTHDRDRDRPAAIPLLPRSDLASSTVPNGQWPIHIHVPLAPVPSRLSCLIAEVFARARQTFPALEPMGAPGSSPWSTLHISLSRAGTWLPRAHLGTCVTMMQADLAHQRPVHVQLGRVAHLVNDLRSRRFLVLECTAGQVGLARWLRVVDQILEKELGRKPFYDKPRFHVSIGYVALQASEEGHCDAQDEQRWEAVTGELTTEFGKQLAGCVMEMSRIQIWTGERAYEVELCDL